MALTWPSTFGHVLGMDLDCTFALWVGKPPLELMPEHSELRGRGIRAAGSFGNKDSVDNEGGDGDGEAGDADGGGGTTLRLPEPFRVSLNSYDKPMR